MGDRCAMTVVVRKEDAERFIEAVRGEMCVPEESGEFEGQVALHYDDVNYAAGISSGDLGRLKGAESIPFYGHHDGGRCYPGGVFVNDGEGRFDVCDAIDGSTVIRVDDTGDIDADEWEHAKAYHRTLAEVLARFPRE